MSVKDAIAKAAEALLLGTAELKRPELEAEVERIRKEADKQEGKQ